MKEQQKYQKAKKKGLETPGIRGKNSTQLQRQAQVTKGETKRAGNWRLAVSQTERTGITCRIIWNQRETSSSLLKRID